METVRAILLVVGCTLGTAVIAANTAIPFLTEEAAWLFFLVGGGVGLVGSVAYLAYRDVKSD